MAGATKVTTMSAEKQRYVKVSEIYVASSTAKMPKKNVKAAHAGGEVA